MSAYTATQNTSSLINTSCPQCVLSDVNVSTSSSSIIITTDVTKGVHDVTMTHTQRDPESIIISKQSLKVVEDVVFLGVNWLFLGVGSVGNALSCVVFWRQGFQDRMNVCLFALGLMDLCCVISWFVMGSPHILSAMLSASSSPHNAYVTAWWKWTVRKYVRGLHRGFLFSSGCLTMLISVERCLCVWLPLRAGSLVGPRAMTVCVGVSVLLVHALHLVYPFKFDVVSIWDEASNRSVVTTRGTQLFQQHSQLFQFVENVVVMTVLPVFTFTVVLIATLLTVLRLMRIVRWRQEVASDNLTMKKAQISLAKMLVVVSLIYILTSCPKIILGLVRAFVPEFWRTGRYSNMFQASHMIYLTLGTFNSTLNVFVYYTRSSRFRREVHKLGPCWSDKHKDSDDHHHY